MANVIGCHGSALVQRSRLFICCFLLRAVRRVLGKLREGARCANGRGAVSDQLQINLALQIILMKDSDSQHLLFVDGFLP